MNHIRLGLGGIVFAVALYFLMAPVFAGNIILPQGFKLGFLNLKFYGLFMAAAVLAGYFVVRLNAWRYGLSDSEAAKVVFWGVICGLVGARLYFILFELDYFLANPFEMLAVWNGGLSLYGGLLAGLIFLLIWPRRKLYTSRQLLDLAVLALPLAQAIGRLGNFFNYEAYGTPTNLPWKMFVPASFRVELLSEFYHPVFLYEALANLVIFIALLTLRGKLQPGGLALLYAGLYALVRFFIEPLRVDSALIAGWRVDQVVSGVVLTGVLIFLVWGHMKLAKK